jgi:hypothetical protein
MAFTEEPPPPPPPNIVRFDADGKPTKAQVEYEIRLSEYLKRMAAAIP